MLVRDVNGITCGEAENAGRILTQIQNRKWDLIILDIPLPGRSGLDVLKNLRDCYPTIPVLVVSMHSEEHYGKRVLSIRERNIGGKASGGLKWEADRPPTRDCPIGSSRFYATLRQANSHSNR